VEWNADLGRSRDLMRIWEESLFLLDLLKILKVASADDGLLVGKCRESLFYWPCPCIMQPIRHQAEILLVYLLFGLLSSSFSLDCARRKHHFPGLSLSRLVHADYARPSLPVS